MKPFMSERASNLLSKARGNPQSQAPTHVTYAPIESDGERQNEGPLRTAINNLRLCVFVIVLPVFVFVASPAVRACTNDRRG